jgi:hypothetical protein
MQAIWTARLAWPHYPRPRPAGASDSSGRTRAGRFLATGVDSMGMLGLASSDGRCAYSYGLRRVSENTLERLTKRRYEHMEANEAGGKFEESFLNIGAAVISHAKASERMEPTDRAFDDPAVHAQTTAMFRAPLGQVRLDSEPTQQATGWLAIVGAVRVDFIRTRTRMAGLAAHRRDVG